MMWIIIRSPTKKSCNLPSVLIEELNYKTRERRDRFLCPNQNANICTNVSEDFSKLLFKKER